MGKFRNGTLGYTEGKVGNVVISKWRGVNYVRAEGRTSTKPPSAKQLVQQAKFRLIGKFIFSLSRLLMETFNDPSEKLTGINRAMRYNINNAVTGIYPDFSIDFTKVLISQGVLLNVYTPTATAIGTGKIKTTWTANIGPNSNADDRCVIVVYCPETNQTIYGMGNSTRSAEADIIDVTLFTGKLVQTWVLFTAADSNAVSTSDYTGSVTVS